jgi:hypothetical protein
MNKDFVSQISYIFLLFWSSRYFTMEDFGSDDCHQCPRGSSLYAMSKTALIGSKRTGKRPWTKRNNSEPYSSEGQLTRI